MVHQMNVPSSTELWEEFRSFAFGSVPVIPEREYKMCFFAGIEAALRVLKEVELQDPDAAEFAAKFQAANRTAGIVASAQKPKPKE